MNHWVNRKKRWNHRNSEIAYLFGEIDKFVFKYVFIWVGFGRALSKSYRLWPKKKLWDIGVKIMAGKCRCCARGFQRSNVIIGIWKIKMNWILDYCFLLIQADSDVFCFVLFGFSEKKLTHEYMGYSLV